MTIRESQTTLFETSRKENLKKGKKESDDIFTVQTGKNCASIFNVRYYNWLSHE